MGINRTFQTNQILRLFPSHETSVPTSALVVVFIAPGIWVADAGMIFPGPVNRHNKKKQLSSPAYVLLYYHHFIYKRKEVRKDSQTVSSKFTSRNQHTLNKPIEKRKQHLPNQLLRGHLTCHGPRRVLNHRFERKGPWLWGEHIHLMGLINICRMYTYFPPST